MSTPTNPPSKKGMSMLTGSLRSISPQRPPIVVGNTMAGIIGDYQAAITAGTRHTPTELASCLYHSSSPYPLPLFITAWREGRFEAPVTDIIQLCFAYRLLIDKYGPRKLDDGAPDTSPTE